MIGYVRGEITSIFPDCCFLEAGGIGYRIFLSDKDREKLSIGQEAKLLTYLAVREDAMLLYGFLSKESYDLFLVLISISKIGPKVAMGILSALEPGAFISAIRTKNMGVLTKLPGVGKKTAERLVVELKDKVGEVEDLEGTEITGPSEGGPMEEAMRYLQYLGYETSEITPILRKVGDTHKTVSQLVQQALQEFGKRK